MSRSEQSKFDTYKELKKILHQHLFDFVKFLN